MLVKAITFNAFGYFKCQFLIRAEIQFHLISVFTEKQFLLVAVLNKRRAENSSEASIN